MAVFYEGKRMPWFIPGMKDGEDINLDPVTFRPEMLPKRMIRMSNDKSLVAIPVLQGRIRIRKDGYVELIYESHYDKDTKQSRNKKVIIGNDASGLLPGMMTPNDNYFDLFNADGRLFNDPMQKTEESTPQKEKPEQTETEAKAQPTNQPSKQVKQNPQTNQPKPEGKPTDSITNEALQQKMRELREKERQLNQWERELGEWQQKLEKKEGELFFREEETEKDHVKLLSYILDSYQDTVEHQAKKKPDAPMTLKQIRTINELLSEFKIILAGCETEDYLHLAEEPDPAANTPGTTNGEMSLILSAYQNTVHAYRYDELRRKK